MLRVVVFSVALEQLHLNGLTMRLTWIGFYTRELRDIYNVYIAMRTSLYAAHCFMHAVHVQFDELHDRVKEDMRGKVEVYRKRLDKEKWEDYQKELTEH